MHLLKKVIGNNTRNLLLMSCSLFLILASYLIFLSFQHPYLGIKVVNINDKLYISKDNSPYVYKEWLETNTINYNDEIIKINNIPIKDPIVKNKFIADQHIITANSIQFHNKSNSSYTIEFNLFDIRYWTILTFIIPLLFSIVSLIFSIFLLIKKGNIPLIGYLITFLLLTSLAFISSHLSSTKIALGNVLVSICMLFSLVILYNFILNYISLFITKKITNSMSHFLYLLPFLPLCLLLSPTIKYYEPLITLSLFIVLFLLILFTLFFNIYIFKMTQLKGLLFSICIPFMPFLFFYALPYTFSEKYFLPAEICVIFLLFIPFNIITFHTVDKLFNINFYIKRLKYYVLISFFFVLCINTFLIIFVSLNLKNMLKINIVLFLACLILLYIKELLDFKYRGILFTVKTQQINSLTQSIQNLNQAVSLENLLSRTKLTVESYLGTDNCVAIVRVNNILTETATNVECETIYKTNTEYIYTLYFENKDQIYIKIDKKKIRLSKEQIIWLELFYNYVSQAIREKIYIENLLKEIELLNLKNNSYIPGWLKKTIFLKVDIEKYTMAQDLHDTILQELLDSIRQLKNSSENESNLNQLKYIAQSLRNYCESLKPPLLLKQGLNVALEQLIYKSIQKKDFKIIYELDRLYLEDEDFPLNVYRIIQELLNNAHKHSQANELYLSLEELDDGFSINYKDNGVGFDIEKIEKTPSFGLNSVKERVYAYNGQITLVSELNQGTAIKISFTDLE